MERYWLKNYPAGVPAEIDADAYRSIPHLFAESVEKYADRTAYIWRGSGLSFAAVDRLSRDLAAWLQSRGLTKGTRIALMMPNVLQYPVAIFGALRAGCIIVNVNPLYTVHELEYQLADSGAEAIIVLENFAATVEQAIARRPLRHVVVASLGDLVGLKGALINLVVRRWKKLIPEWHIPDAVGFRSVLSDGSRLPLDPVDIGPDDIAFLQYTGGTTGVSKGAILLHRNILANLSQVSAWFAPAQRDNEPEILVTPLPLYHSFALTANCLYQLKQGGTIILITNPRDIAGFVKELSREKFTAITGINTLYNALLSHPDFSKIDFSRLRMATAGGMAVQSAVAERWKNATGVAILEGYGLSEASPVVTINPVNGHDGPANTIGLPLPSTAVTIRDDAGQILPVGEVGEICVSGPQVMQGYWNRPDETARVLTMDGALKTGDLGCMDERGFVRIVDRKKDMILVSGFNVYPTEIEDVVAKLPGVFECAVIGVADQKSGEAPKLFVVRKDANLTEADIIAHCRQYLTAYKIPRHVEFRDTLPKTNVGKILRRQLKEEASSLSG